MTTKYVDGSGLAYFYSTYCLTEAQVNTLISTQLTAYKQDIVTVTSALPSISIWFLTRLMEPSLIPMYGR